MKCLLICSPTVELAQHNTTTQHYTTPLHYTTLHYTTLHYTTLLHCTALHCTALHYTTLHYTTLHNAAQRNTAQHSTIHIIVPYSKFRSRGIHVIVSPLIKVFSPFTSLDRSPKGSHPGRVVRILHQSHCGWKSIQETECTGRNSVLRYV